MEKTQCINICELDGDGVCIGCNRTVHEIKNWSTFTEEEREAILNPQEQTEEK